MEHVLAMIALSIMTVGLTTFIIGLVEFTHMIAPPGRPKTPAAPGNEEK